MKNVIIVMSFLIFASSFSADQLKRSEGQVVVKEVPISVARGTVSVHFKGDAAKMLKTHMNGGQGIDMICSGETNTVCQFLVNKAGEISKDEEQQALGSN